MCDKLENEQTRRRQRATCDRRRYLASSSLTGNIHRMSSNPLTAADLTLPVPGDNGSLSHHADIVIDSVYQVRNHCHGTVGIVGFRHCRYGRYSRRIPPAYTGSTLGLCTADTASIGSILVFCTLILRVLALLQHMFINATLKP